MAPNPIGNSLRTKLLVLCFFSASLAIKAVPPDQKKLPIGLSQEESQLRYQGREATTPPPGPVRSLAEWETAESVMTLWPNASLLKALSERGKVHLFADGPNEVDWWKRFLQQNQLNAEQFSYFVTSTDSIWIRDYGPWFIIDGNKSFGIVDNTYNRPRPSDDVVPEFLAEKLKLPYYHTGLTHTGGNYYNDGQGNAFSSTLVYRENHNPMEWIDSAMRNFLGIARYTTSPLGVGVTIEHLDTFGKLVSPDTWVFADFPESSRFKKDAETMMKKLEDQRSPLGTRYKIFRLKMFKKGSGENYRAYLNSFISNRALYFPSYGGTSLDEADSTAKAVYEKALPGYEIVPVDNDGTSWGDSVHCRNRNLLTHNTIFLFPTLTKESANYLFQLEALPSPGARFEKPPTLVIRANGKETKVPFVIPLSGTSYELTYPTEFVPSGFQFFIEATDSLGISKTYPAAAPQQTIKVDAE